MLIHGAANSAKVWPFWQRELAQRGWLTYAVDLRGHGQSEVAELGATTMADYAADVRTLIHQLAQPPLLIGWSMGGLVAMMVAATDVVAGCVGLAPSLPARRLDDSVALRQGTFGAEEYGIISRNPDEQPAMPDLDREERLIALASLGPESRLARDERKRGIVIEKLGCPLLLVTGSDDRQWPSEQYAGLWLQADRLVADGASHWGLVLNRRALSKTIPSVVDWMVRAAVGLGKI
ncbi:MAG TPA: alpha/beta fold hydrolase [Chloroflexota bacterium]|nr:alpha/beta fold hydrolase [Chloroflexota bacterium]